MTVTNGGSDYLAAPEITFDAPATGTRATGTAVVSSGAVTGVIITNHGSGYTSVPFVAFAEDHGGSAIPFTSAGIDSVTVTTRGTGYVLGTLPTVTFGAPQLTGTTAVGKAVLSGSVGSLNVTDGGAKYTNDPTITIDAPPSGGTPATGLSVFAGEIDGCNIGGGVGYVAAPTVTIIPIRPPLTTTATVSGGKVTSIATPNAGAITNFSNFGGTLSGYTANQAVTIQSGGGSGTGFVGRAIVHASNGSLINVAVVNGGSGYTAGTVTFVGGATATLYTDDYTNLMPVVVITGGGGTGAKAVAEKVSNQASSLSNIRVLNGGSGYTSAPTVTITTGSGGAVAAEVETASVNADFAQELAVTIYGE